MVKADISESIERSFDSILPHTRLMSSECEVPYPEIPGLRCLGLTGSHAEDMSLFSFRHVARTSTLRDPRNTETSRKFTVSIRSDRERLGIGPQQVPDSRV